MFNLLKKSEPIRRPVKIKFFIKDSLKFELEKTINELENEVNYFIKHKEIVSTKNTITFVNDSNNYLIFFQIDYVDESTFIERIIETINTKYPDINTENVKVVRKKWYHI